jgi:uncharacterized membrane protein HdeD (DUF308 family)
MTYVHLVVFWPLTHLLAGYFSILPALQNEHQPRRRSWGGLDDGFLQGELKISDT